MTSTYKIIEVVGTSENSWEEAVKNAVETAAKSLEDLRIAEVTRLDAVITDGKVTAFRARVSMSFKYHGE
ncbi:MAG: transporter [Deltaproteobacteria bacterium]|nr:MAG: transporter [Deltaproteobacteria bacterium]